MLWMHRGHGVSYKILMSVAIERNIEPSTLVSDTGLAGPELWEYRTAGDLSAHTMLLPSSSINLPKYLVELSIIICVLPNFKWILVCLHCPVHLWLPPDCQDCFRLFSGCLFQKAV